MVFGKIILLMKVVPQQFVDVSIGVTKIRKCWWVSVKDPLEQDLVILGIKAKRYPLPSLDYA